MSYEPLTATKTLLADFYHEADWLDVDSNIALWELFNRSYGFDLSELEKDIEVLESHTPRDLAVFVNAHAKGSTRKLESQCSHQWLAEYKKWVLSKRA